MVVPVDDENVHRYRIRPGLHRSWTSCRWSSPLAEPIQCGKTERLQQFVMRSTQRRLVRVRSGLFADAELWQQTSNDRRRLRHVLEARAAWLSLGRRGWASHYTAAVLNGLPVPHGQPALVTISQATRGEGRRLYRSGRRLRTAHRSTHATSVQSGEWRSSVQPERPRMSPACTASQQALCWRMRHWPAASPTQAELHGSRPDDRLEWIQGRAPLRATMPHDLRESPVESCLSRFSSYVTCPCRSAISGSLVTGLVVSDPTSAGRPTGLPVRRMGRSSTPTRMATLSGSSSRRRPGSCGSKRLATSSFAGPDRRFCTIQTA